MATGIKREIACFSPRGEGKTVAALWAMVMHAAEHHTAGYPLPTSWLGVRDTLENHKLSTHKTLREPFWQGAWDLTDGGRVATYRLEGVPLTQINLVGVDSPSDAERLRTQCHGLWFEEAAPAMTISLGLDESAWNMGLSSQRLPTHRRVAMLTTNYGDIDHWTWRRFVTDSDPDRTYFRIPKGERADPTYQAELERAYKDRPDLYRRLVEGRPGIVLLGKQVAIGFNEDTHVRPARPVKDLPVYIGQDGGESHTWCSVVAQRVGPHVNVLASLLSDPSGARQHVKQLLLPWLSEHCPWVIENPRLLEVMYDQACDTEDPGDVDSNPLRTMRALLPARYVPGPVTWPGRLNPIYSLLNDGDGHGEPRLRIDPSCRGLIVALRGGWYLTVGVDGRVRKDTPHKPNHPHEDYGDAFCYAISAVAPTAPERESKRPGYKPAPSRIAFQAFDPWAHARSRT